MRIKMKVINKNKIRFKMEIRIKHSEDVESNKWYPHNKIMKEIRLNMNQE